MYLVKPVGDLVTLNVTKNISFICFYLQAPRRLKGKRKIIGILKGNQRIFGSQ